MQIEAKNVSYCYKGKHQMVQAVKDCSYVFTPGKLYAITGASGSGKSTMLSMLAGLKQPSGGCILVDGKDMRKLDRSQLRRNHISVIYQDFNLFPYLNAQENVLYPLKLQKAKKASAKHIADSKLKDVGIKPEQFRRLPAMLSGGEQQRVSIARALAAGSQVILADEPTGNLDSENTANIIEILKNLAHNSNKCVIVVTHDPMVVAQADTVLQMLDGHWE